MKESTRVLIALCAAIAIGAIIAVTGSPRLLRMADFIAPLGTLWVNAIRMTVIPLVVSLLITGVASATDVRAIGRIGRRTLLVFILLLVAMSAVVIPLASLVFAVLPQVIAARPALPAGAAEAAAQIASGGQTQSAAMWLVSLIPSNPIAAAANGAMLPLILFTLLFGLAITRSTFSARAAMLGFSVRLPTPC